MSGEQENQRPIPSQRVSGMTAEKKALETNLRAECDQPRIRPEAGRDVAAERRTVHVGNRVREIVVVPYVEEIASQLKLPVFFKGDLLHNAEIPILKRRPAERIASKIAATRHRIRQRAAARPERGYHDSGSVDRRAERAEVSGNGVLGNYS